VITIHPRSYYIGTTAERTALSLPADAVGAKFFDTDLTAEYIWNGSSWQAAGGGGFPAGAWLDTTSGAMDWAPDSVALLHNGVLEEESDPDDAFDAAVSGDVILVPPGTWTLTSAHSLTGVSIHGTGPATKCILQATSNVGMILLQVNGGEWDNFTVKYLNCDVPAARIALVIYNGRAFNVHGECYNLQNSGSSTGLHLAATIGVLCHGLATGGATKVGILVGGADTTLYYCTGETSTTTVSAGTGILVNALLARFLWCRGISLGAHGTGISLSNTSYALFCSAEGGDKDFSVSGSSYLYDCQYDTLSGNPIFLPGDRAGKGRDETITGTWTHSNPIKGSGAPTIGTTTEAEKWGHVYLALERDIFPDGETDVSAGFWKRFVNRASSYTHHRGTGTGVPAGCTLTATPSNLWSAWHASYRGWFGGTFYQHYPTHASVPAGLTVHSADPIADSKHFWARVHVTGACEFGLWADNFDANRSYVVDDYIYRFNAYAYGNGPQTLLYTNVSTSVCTAPGIGVAATFAAWINHANTGPYGPFGPCGDGIVILLIANYVATTSRCYAYVIGEQGGTSGFGSYLLYDDAWPGTSLFAARRMGTFNRVQGFAGSCWDWYYV